MYPRQLLTDIMRDLRHRRPNARVLVLEARQEDVITTIEWLRNAGHMAGDGNHNRVLVLVPREYVQRRRKVGPVDVVILHNQHNIARADRAPSIDTATKNLRAQRHRVDFLSTEPDPILGVSPAPTGWACGTPYTMDCGPWRMSLPPTDGEPCGFINPLGTWHCEACGIFRGINYGVVL